MTDFRALLTALVEARVEFLIVGGAADIAHGSALTYGLDVVYRRTRENIERIVTALRSLNPYPRGAPAGLPFQWDEQSVLHGLNFTLSTSHGDLDLLGDIPGGNYDSLLPHTVLLRPFGIECRCLDLPRLIEVKRAAGRPRDYESIAELEIILEERNQ